LNDPAEAHAVIIKLNPALNAEWMQFPGGNCATGTSLLAGIMGVRSCGEMSPERWKIMFQHLTDLKMLEKPFDPAAAYTLQFVQSGSTVPNGL
jgi:hypothetical protein